MSTRSAPNFEGSRNIQDAVGIEVSEEFLWQVDTVNADYKGHEPQAKAPGVEGEYTITALYILCLYQAPDADNRSNLKAIKLCHEDTKVSGDITHDYFEKRDPSDSRYWKGFKMKLVKQNPDFQAILQSTMYCFAAAENDPSPSLF
jgi:hypothetical protein